ncbi:PIN domain-containing protein [Pseudomonas sp. OTU750018]|uniref:PIN domain-containing protein n=1 Tax=Pseudomonas sp. OTU750018 TaxID=2709708 RepID=UPI001422C2B3|nr:PIN domain-containing protein [Pseudomonas sp. OTU750018]
MKDKFPGHFATAISTQDIWNSCIFVFDANILLNLYRYSDETRALFLKTLEGIKDRIWIPNRVAMEYLENRLDVIHEQQEEYEKAIAEITKLKAKLENSRQHPFVSTKTMKEVSSSLEKACKELSENKEIHNKRINFDEIKDAISEIFNDSRIGDKFDSNKLEDIIKEGAGRYAQKIPPGYSDIKKQSTEESLAARCRPYGDLIIWKAILEKANERNSSVIFVTDDGKEDWWQRFKGKTLGPRPELIEEFKAEVDKEFHMYLPERFLSFASQNNNKPSKEILDEIVDIRKKEQAAGAVLPSFKVSSKNASKLRVPSLDDIKFYLRDEHKNKEDSIVISWKDETANIRQELEAISAKINYLTIKSDNLRRDGLRLIEEYGDATDPEDEPNYLSIKSEHAYILGEIRSLNAKRSRLVERIINLDNNKADWRDI